MSQLRALLGYDRQLCAEVLAAVIAELSRSLCAVVSSGGSGTTRERVQRAGE
jgi:hypothetical protein